MKTRGISAKIMLIYGIAFLIIILATFWVSYFGTVGRLKQDLEATNMALLKQVDEKIEVTFRQTEKELLALTEDVDFVYFMYGSFADDAQRSTTFFNIRRKLESLVTSNANFSSVFVYSSVAGGILTDNTYMQDAAAEENWLRDYIDIPNYVEWLTTHQIWDGRANNDVITLVRPYPVLSRPGFRKGVMAVNINEKALYDMIKAIYEDRKIGHLFILDEAGNVVTHDDKSQIYRNMTNVPYIRDILSEESGGIRTAKIDGVKQSVFYRTSGYTGWKLVSIVPQAQIYKPLMVTRNLLIALAAGMLALALIVLIYVNRWAFKPLDRLIGKVSDAYHARKPQLQGAGVNLQGLDYLENIFEHMMLDRENLERHARDSKPVLKWRVMMDLLMGYRTEFQAVRHQLEFVGVTLCPERYLVCMAEIGKAGEALSSRDEALYTFVFCNVAEELIHAEHAGFAIDLGGGKAVVLFSFAEGDNDQNHVRALAILELIVDVAKKQFGLIATVGVGRAYREMKDIPLSYDESRKALHYKMLFGQHAVISIESLQPPDSQDYYRLSLKAEPIAEALKLTDTVRMKKGLESLFADAVVSNLPPEFIYQLSFDIIMKSLQTAGAIGIELETQTESMDWLYAKLRQCESWKEAEQLVLSVLEQLSAQIELKRSARGKNDTIDRMLAYIQEHYRENDLSLDRLADEFQLSPTYISKLFKEHTENNFIDHLIEIRINASKTLLTDPDMKVNKIGEAVGYTNTGSFLRIFKKYTGLTPTEYRDSMKDRP